MSKINKQFQGIQVMVYPWKKGFTCGIFSFYENIMTPEESELCSTIARGMIKMATDDPHKTFMLGMKGFSEDKRSKSKSNLIDFLDYLKIKRNKEFIKNQ